MQRKEVYAAIDSERDFQDRKWGTIEKHPHEVAAWVTLMRVKLADAETAWAGSPSDDLALEEIRKAVALGIACLEQHGCKSRWKFTDARGGRIAKEGK